MGETHYQFNNVEFVNRRAKLIFNWRQYTYEISDNSDESLANLNNLS